MFDIFYSFVTKKFSCASKRQARLIRKICACVQLAELKTRHELVILIRHVVFNSASCTHAQIFLFRRACRLLAAHENFFVTNDEKYQTCLMYYLQHERPCCIGYTNSSRRREFVYPIQHGRECCKWLKKRLIL